MMPEDAQPDGEAALPTDADILILFEDMAQEIRSCETTKAASEVFNRAVDSGDLPRPKLNALQVILKEKIAALSKKK